MQTKLIILISIYLLLQISDKFLLLITASQKSVPLKLEVFIMYFTIAFVLRFSGKATFVVGAILFLLGSLLFSVGLKEMSETVLVVAYLALLYGILHDISEKVFSRLT